MGDRSSCGAPRLGYIVQNDQLIGAFKRTAPGLTLVVAPGGCGKTVLAAQFASSAAPDSLWVRMGGCSPSAADFAGALAAQLRSQSRNLLLRVDPGNCVADDPGWALLEAELLAIHDFPNVVVVDGIGVLPTSELAFLLLELLRRLHGPSIQLILTCRRVQERFNAATHDASPWMISSSELRFTLGQVAALAQHVLQRQLEDEDLQTLALASGGQPALLLLLLRHISVSNVSIEDAIRQSPGDVVGNLEESIESEGRTGVLDALGVAALLGSGSVKQLVMLSGTSTETIAAAAQVAPLLRVTNDSSGSPRFDMHDLACDVYGQAALARWWSGSSGSIEAIETELAFRGDFHRLFRLLIQSNRQASLVAWTEKLGGLLLEDACLGLLASVLDHIPTRMQAGSVRLLLVGAMLLRCQGQTTEALKRVITARQLASAQCDDALERECLMAEARLRWDLAQYSVLLPQLTRAHQRALLDKDQDTATLTSAYLASAYAQLGDVRQGREYVEVYQSIYRLPGVRASTRAQTVSMVLLVLGVVCGDLASASEVLKVLRNEAGLPRDSRLLCEGNLAALLMGMGRVQAARDIAAKVRGSLSASGLNVLLDSLTGTEAACCAAQGDLDGAERMMSQAIELAVCAEDRFGLGFNRIDRSTMRRACGRNEDALSDAEDALAAFTEQEGALPIMACLARCEVAASFLSLGDRTQALRLATNCRAMAEEWIAAYHLLRADMILAEIERQQGSIEDAVERIALHADYVCTESANWQVAMYIRAFPGLLGVFSRAIGADALPGHMLRMVLLEHAHSALEAAAEVESREGIERLSVRLLGRKGATARSKRLESTPAIRVQLFGGMEVETPSGRIADKDWRKRKARLMFAIVVLQRGKDLPREQLFEHLWPEMTEDRAKSNFYVIWSIMRRVLMGTTTGGPCPFVEHQAGVCRIVPSLVTSDVGDFEDALVAMRRADRAGDSDLARAAADDVAQYYRGELLPGEIYDDWLAPIRDRYRHDYGDAMLRAAYLHHEAGDTEKALHMVRAALSQDPWREDLYQAALRYLIHSGQRSGAIEIYTACRSKLADDLGLDPSLETRRLYDEILAMEDRPASDTLL